MAFSGQEARRSSGSSEGRAYSTYPLFVQPRTTLLPMRRSPKAVVCPVEWRWLEGATAHNAAPRDLASIQAHNVSKAHLKLLRQARTGCMHLILALGEGFRSELYLKPASTISGYLLTMSM